ncbi:hypothetical protein EYR40_006394 [Pleurotus pulmonarius]|nr:hypothetical protein EYR40_006394 [Pleurotus pulmonarius]
MAHNSSSGDNTSPSTQHNGRRLRNRAMLVALVLGSTLLGMAMHSYMPAQVQNIERRDVFEDLDARSSSHLKQCPSFKPLAAKPPAPINLWAPLSVDEISDVYKYLKSPSRSLNLTLKGSTPSDNSVFLIEALRPAKADALKYLAKPNHVKAPERYARVVLHHGAQERPVVKDYIIGPLPVSKRTTMEERTGVYHRDDIPYEARVISYGAELGAMMTQLMPPLAEAMQGLLGGVGVGLANDTITAEINGPWSIDGSFRRAWLFWKRSVPGQFMFPLNLFMYIDMTGTDVSQWKTLKLIYEGRTFTSTEAFLEAFRNGELKPQPKEVTDGPTSWGTRARPHPDLKLDLDHLPGPRTVPFAGLRFRVDEKRRYISWMGWGMYLGFDREMGMSLWDIRFRNERIIYELSPQDALAQYSGANPFSASTAWLDRWYGMGQTVRPLMPLYDCPAGSVYLPATIFDGEGVTKVTPRATCIFEMDTNRPITRHAGWGVGDWGAVKGYVLVVRSISTVGNYDYRQQWDYTFGLDGSIEVRVSASGYVQASPPTPEEEPYSGKIFRTSRGALHDHVVNFKVDLDILGTANSFLKTSMAQEEVTQPWFDDEWGTTGIQQRVSRDYIQTEADSRVNYPTNFQGGYSIVNKDKHNDFGTVRGYTIMAGPNPIHAAVTGSPRALRNANWAGHNIAVTKRKDNEHSSSSMWNQHLPGNPTINFDKFFDGESLDQEDLVAWINVGTHHLPQAEDAPHVRTTTATTSFTIAPHNYFDSDPSLDSLNAIIINQSGDPKNPLIYEDYGVDQSTTCIPEKPKAFEYTNPQEYDADSKAELRRSFFEKRSGFAAGRGDL